ncbi:MAG: zinc ribbon domain-containing protein [Deltaproteobacteria bacterium]|nr:zinc ribbon domain-containing protein [Deltaproteobacteria bacterium]
MPIYEYRCKACDCEFETLIIGSADTAQCPQCRCEDVVRLMSACSHKNEGKYVSSSGSGCGGCSATSCSTCH